MLGIAGICFMVMLAFETIDPVSGSTSSNIWYYLIMFLVFLAIIAFLLNFYRLNIMITAELISVRFGLFKKKISWNSIKSCSKIKANAISYGGWGIRTREVEGAKSQAYVVSNCDQIILELNSDKLKELVFSTKNANLVREIVMRKIGKAE